MTPVYIRRPHMGPDKTAPEAADLPPVETLRTLLD
jgi:hypothetical protein